MKKITVKDICAALEEFASLALQENYDNAGLLMGRRDVELSGVLLCIDITETVVQEAINKKCNMIVSHHPLIFRGLKSITGSNSTERCVIAAIKHDIAIYACHTNIDSVAGGVSFRMAQKLGLQNIRVLQPAENKLMKLVVFVPENQTETLQNALFEAGAGNIGNYDRCSYTMQGKGSFRANEMAKPFVGETNQEHIEPEVRIEMIAPTYLKSKLTRIIFENHPYEEPAFDFIPVQNHCVTTGSGAIGELQKPISENDFLQELKKIFQIPQIRHTAFTGHLLHRIAVCGGSGANLLQAAIAQKADVFVSADFKYHDFFEVENRLLIADTGHFETEQYTKEIFFEQLMKKFPNFAVRISEINTNPVNYI